MKAYKPIGILGGMGPQATVLLQQRLIDAIQADDDEAHIPLMVDMNPQVPSRLSYLLENKGKDPAPTLQKMAKRLENMGAKALAMPCNTAHHFAGAIEDAVEIPLLNMVKFSAKRAAKLIEKNPQKIGILASPATDDIDLFHKAFAPYGVECIYPKDRDLMLSAIRRIKADGISQRDKEALIEGAQDCQKMGAQALIVGCSEFSLIGDVVKDILPTLDTIDVLVDKIIEFSQS